MKLKKIIPVLLFAMCTTLVMPAFAKNPTPLTPTEKAQREAHAQVLINRLQQIREMDKNHLTSSEKKELRTELKAMKKEFRADKRNGIYLSIGGLIIIILLLILILR